MTKRDLNPHTRIYQVAELKCFLCGTSSGAVEREPAGAFRGVVFRPTGAAEVRPVRDWRELRCARCGGPTFLDEAELVTRRDEPVNWLDERPRRGRPPKRVVDQRRAADSNRPDKHAA